MYLGRTCLTNIGVFPIIPYPVTDGPSVVRSILSCGHYKRTYHCSNLCPPSEIIISFFLVKSFFLSYPSYEKTFYNILEHYTVPTDT